MKLQSSLNVITLSSNNSDGDGDGDKDEEDDDNKLNIFYFHTGSVLMNAIATQNCTHDPTFRHSSPRVFIRVI